MAFNCDFNAPMFVDFDNMEGEENADEFFGKFLVECYEEFWVYLRIRFLDTHNEDGPLMQDETASDLPPRVTRASTQKPSQPLKRKWKQIRKIVL